MRESDLLKHIYQRSADLPSAFGQVVVGPGDDCAVVRMTAGGALLVTVDQLVEGRHFLSDPPIPTDLIARKAIARSISDIAAMGGTPMWALATAALPDGYPHADALFDAMSRWARHWGAPLVGGDITNAPKGAPLILTCTVGGLPHAQRGPVLRSGAKVGDSVWVTGKLGGSLASGRHLTFEPRLHEARWLCDRLGADLHSMIDISDGLGIDSARIAAASSEGSPVRVEIDAASLPRHEGATVAHALGDGEDYELCFTTSGDADLPPEAPASGGKGNGPIKVTRIGRVVSGTGCVVKYDDGRVADAAELGWDHGRG